MPGIKVVGMEVFNKTLDKLASEISHINNMALYEAAGYVADKISKAIQNMPTRSEEEYATDKWKLYGATESEKQQIAENFGVSRFRHSDGTTMVSIGFTGYVRTPSTRFNDMVPTGMLMQCINYGNQYRRGTHTIDHAVSGIKAEVEQIIQSKIDEEISKLE